MVQGHRHTIPVFPKSQVLSAGMALVILTLIVLLFFSPNPGLSIFSILTLVVIYFRLWIPGQPPVFFLALTLQWLQASTRIFQANLAGLPLNEMAGSPYAEKASAIALTALLAISISLGWMIRRNTFNLRSFYLLLFQVNIRRVFIVFLAFFFLLPFLNSFKSGGLSQIIHSIQSVKWAIYSLLIFASLVQKKGKIYLGTTFALEFVLGVTGYFSSFQDVLFVTFISFFTAVPLIRTKEFLFALPFIAAVFSIMVVWQGVKTDYRKFLSGGKEAQIVTVEKEEALSTLWNLATDFKKEDIQPSLDAMLNRLEYTFMLQLAIEYVPSVVPHENGKLWGGAVMHVITPRIFFPDKPIINDSETASKFTGRDWRGLEHGVSISLGYVAESYVDFGFPGLLVIMLLLGLLMGSLYNAFFSFSSEKILLDAGAVTFIFLIFRSYETVASKIIGGILMNVIVYFVIVRPLLYPLVLKYILRK